MRMTSKQVQKAYKAANRAPRMSRAEQRKQERAEQERIRKELEKEKAASKAKAVREKKKEKEAADREMKRKKGLPLVTVNASQDTIARFVRGNGMGKKRDSGGRETNAVGTLPPVQEMPPPPIPSPKKAELNALEKASEDDLELDMPTKKRMSMEPEGQPPRISSSADVLPLPPISPPIASPPTAELDDLDKGLQDDITLETSEKWNYAGRKDKIPETSKIHDDAPTRPSTTPWRMELDDLDDVFQDDLDLDLTGKTQNSGGGLMKAFEASRLIDKEPLPPETNNRKAEMDVAGKEPRGDIDVKISDKPALEVRGARIAKPSKRTRKFLLPPPPQPAKPRLHCSDDLEDLDEEFLTEMNDVGMVMEAWEGICKRGSEPVKPVGAHQSVAEPDSVDPEPLLSKKGPQEADVSRLDEDFDNDFELDMLQGLDAMMEENVRGNTLHEGQERRHISGTNSTSQCFPRPPRPRTRVEKDLGLQIPIEQQPTTFKVPPKPQRRPSQQPSPLPPRQAPPLSTQAIFLNFDDFFPSPSQQARELEEEKVLTQPTPVRPRERPSPEPEPSPEHQPEYHPGLETELLEEPGQGPNSSSPPQRRFFTSSGSHELMALAIQRSRRTAALEQLHQKEQSRIEAGMIVKAEAEERAKQNQKMRKASTMAKTTKDSTKPRTPMFLGKRGQTTETARTPTFLVKRNQTTTQYVNTPMKPPEPPTKQKGHETRLETHKENIKPNDPSASQESEYGGDWVDEIALELMI